MGGDGARRVVSGRHARAAQYLVQADRACLDAPALRSQVARQRHAFPEGRLRSEEHTSELQSLMRISYAVFCLKKKTTSLLFQLLCNRTLASSLFISLYYLLFL